MDDLDGLSVQQFTEELQAAGFELLAARYEAALIPVQVAWAATTCSPGEGGRRDVSYQLDDPDLVDNLNSMWAQMATEVGLFDHCGKFLLSVNSESSELLEPHWALVARIGDPDIAGIGSASGIFGFRQGYIEFAAASLDGRAVIRGTLWQSSAGLLGLNDARSSVRLREYATGLVERRVLTVAEQAQVWLGSGGA
ncbi:hypothetical protein [Spirillospora sp. NPDC048823]|uniref:hypothetical protein n=1 Tax=Spirillospora sp. NPDC048823 TaxID=3364525 RepID=UPI003719DAD0